MEVGVLSWGWRGGECSSMSAEIQRHTAEEEKWGARRGNGLSLIIVQREGLFERSDAGVSDRCGGAQVSP